MSKLCAWTFCFENFLEMRNINFGFATVLIGLIFWDDQATKINFASRRLESTGATEYVSLKGECFLSRSPSMSILQEKESSINLMVSNTSNREKLPPRPALLTASSRVPATYLRT